MSSSKIKQQSGKILAQKKEQRTYLNIWKMVLKKGKKYEKSKFPEDFQFLDF